MFDLVIARYNEDISWLSPYLEHNINIIIYNKGEPLVCDERIKVVQLENIGREAHTYLYHICNNYDSLNNVTVFLQGRIDDHIDGSIYEEISKMCQDASICGFSKNYTHLTTDIGYDYTLHNYCDNDLDQCEVKLGPFFEQFVGRFPKHFLIYRNALFAVRSDVIRNRPLFYYKSLLNLDFTKNSVLAHYMERIWLYIFLFC